MDGGDHLWGSGDGLRASGSCGDYRGIQGCAVIGVSLRRIPPGLPAAGIPVVRIHVDADPTMTDAKREILRAKYTSEARYRREIEIEYEALEGELVLPEFSRKTNLCE